MPDYIDPEELPFTAEEIYQAAGRFYPQDVARQMADHLAECAPGLIEARTERRAGWRAAGIPNADSMLLHGWAYPDELLPALASLSADAESRARRLMKESWESSRLGDIARLQQVAAEQSGLIPTMEEIRAQSEREMAESGGDEELLNGLAISLPELPPPTDEMVAIAAASVHEKRRAWDAMVDRFRRDARSTG